MQPRVSIIIPVYNAEPYLDSCITSIVNQSFSDLEIVFVDDRSTDSSAFLIEKETIVDTRIRLFKQTSNQGAPAARNQGMLMAKGAYFMFMDADDMLPTNALEILVRVADRCNSDAVKGTMLVKHEKSKKLKPHRLNQKRIHTATQLADCHEIQHLYQYQSYLFRAEILKTNAIEFDQDLKNFQDPVFLAKLLPKCPRIDVCASPVYIRRVRAGSIITSNWGVENYLSMVHGAARAYDNLLKEHQLGAADLMTKTFTNWWSKLEQMPNCLSKSECFQVFSGIEAFSRSSEYEISDFSWLKVGKYHSLKLISNGRFEDAYQQMASRARMKTKLGLPLLTLYDIAVYSKSRLHKQL